MSLYRSLENDMKVALKDGNAVKLSVLRMLISAIRMFELEKNLKEPQEGDILQIIQRQVKQRRESIDQFHKGNRKDLADKETLELKILESYLPKQLTEDELLEIVKACIVKLGATKKSETGKVMKAVIEKTKGKSDGKTVNRIVMKLLA
ncbi:MAG: GatB/YqeY domain-containing protein [Candidatus Omnitrophota bacterium]|nr:GatB/YqeY domain-containing protein [Candidatus Omnitrophota bacterium]